MHKDYSKDGLVVLTATLDDYKDKRSGEKTRATVLNFLNNKLKVPFKTVHLDPTDRTVKLLGVKAGKLRADGVPVVFVFNREGKYVLKLPTYDKEENIKDEVDYDKVEKAVREETRKK
jgi:thioredoxin-related protein